MLGVIFVVFIGMVSYRWWGGAYRYLIGYQLSVIGYRLSSLTF